MMDDDELVIFDERINNGDLMFLLPNVNPKGRSMTIREGGITRSLGALLAERALEDPTQYPN